MRFLFFYFDLKFPFTVYVSFELESNCLICFSAIFISLLHHVFSADFTVKVFLSIFSLIFLIFSFTKIFISSSS